MRYRLFVRIAFVLLVCLSLPAISSQQDAAPPPVSKSDRPKNDRPKNDRPKTEDFLPPEACMDCHPQHYEEWRGSMHAYSMQDPVFFAMNTFGQKDTEGELGDFCTSCHGPVGTLTGEITPDIQGPESLSRVAAAGISCEVCHRDVRINAAHPENFSLEIQPGGAMIGGIADPISNGFHKSKKTDLLRNPDFCGSCHNVTTQAGIRVEKPHVEFKASPYPEERLTRCIDCHMQTYTGRATPDGPIRRHLHRHDFVGVDVALDPFPRMGFQKREIERFLRTAARLRVETPKRVERDQAFQVNASVKNVGSGHNLPTGPSTERQMWLEVTLRSATGAVLFESGKLDENGDWFDEHGAGIPGETPEAGESKPRDEQLVKFTDRFLDSKGEEVPFMWQAASLEEHTIPPLETRKATYRLPPPPRAEELELEVRLLFRAFPPHQLRRLGLNELKDRFPIFVMQEHRSTIQVLDALRPKDQIRVPRDETSIRAAIARAIDDPAVREVLIAPGIHRIDGPIDPAGRALRIAASDPSSKEDTVIELSENVADAELTSLVRCVSGETSDCRFEGLTFRNGRGSLVDGQRLGGSVLCIDSDPLFIDCVVESSTAGLGGGLYFRNSSAQLFNLEVRDNRADVHGGGLAIVESQVRIEASHILRNRAPDGGGAWIQGGGSQITESRILRNVAVRGGGLAFVTDPQQQEAKSVLLLDHSFVAANSAKSGGAFFGTGHGRSRWKHNVLAGNMRGAITLEGRVRVDAPRTTLMDNRFGPPVRLSPDAKIHFSSSILWGNSSGTVVPLSGDVSWSTVDDPAHQNRDDNLAEIPVFHPPHSVWDRCLEESDLCVPAVTSDLASANRHFRRFDIGSYDLVQTAKIADRGDPLSPPDPDGTRADLGARFARQARRLFLRGDVNGDGTRSFPDLRKLAELIAATAHSDIQAVEQPLRPAALPCTSAADTDGNGFLSPADIVCLAATFFSGAALPAPFEDCGLAEPGREDRLGCFETRCSADL